MRLFSPLICFLGGLLACGRADSQPEQPAAPPAAAPAPAAALAPDTVAAPVPALTAAEQAHEDTVRVLNKLIQARYPELSVGWFIRGDLNADKRPDLIVVGEEADEDSVRHRTAFLVLNEGYPRLRLAAVNTTVVCSSNDGGWGVDDPVRGIVIKGNYFSFEHLLGGPERTYDIVTFHYDRHRRDWLLHRIDETNYSMSSEPSQTTRTRKDFGVVRFADYVRAL